MTVDYAGDFHLDVVPRVTINGKHCVCDRNKNRFEETDGDGYRNWFNETNRITGGNLKRVVRLLKHLRDHKNSFSAKSILLTTLAGSTIRASDQGTVAVSTVADTLETVLSRISDYLQQHHNMPVIKNPVLSTEDFNRHWDQRRYSNFRDRVQSYARTAKQAKAEPDAEKAIKLWQELFGDKFRKSSTSGGGGSSGQGSIGGALGGAASAASPPVVRRPNESRPLRIETMNGDHFHIESLEVFERELAVAGFEPVTVDGFSVWRGPIHQSFSELTSATTMDVVARPGWPFQSPALIVEGLDSNHATPGGFVCLWQDGDPSCDWVTVGGFFARIGEWCENAKRGWDGDDLQGDAFLNFLRKSIFPFPYVATVDLPELKVRSGSWGEIHGAVSLNPPRLDIRQGRQERRAPFARPLVSCGRIGWPASPQFCGNVPLPV